MRREELRHGDIVRLELRPDGDSDFRRTLSAGQCVDILRSESTGECLMRLDSGDTVAVRGNRPPDQSLLERLLAAPKARVAWIIAASPKGHPSKAAVVEVHEFMDRRFTERLAIGIDDLFLESARKHLPDVSSVEALKTWMRDTLVVDASPAGRQMILVQGATAEVAKESDRAFRLLGTRWAVDVKAAEDGRMLATRLVTVRESVQCGAARPPLIIEGSFEFVDGTFATSFKAESSLDVLVREAGSYLSIWEQYQHLETDSIARRARLFGSVPYHGCSQLDNGYWHFEVADAFFESGRSLEDLPADEFDIECVRAIPALLKASTSEDMLTVLDDVRPDERTPFTGTVVSLGDGNLVLRPADPDARMENAPPESGYLVAGLRGDMVRLRRRRDAWERIRRQSCPMPHLGHLLEGQNVARPRRQRLAPMSEAVRAKFGGEPTSKQRQALDIALNTPDIAVIQGPPGTGKTRVLAALQARLSELEESERLSGSVLLTGYQHTAVENAVMSASTLGLPPIKIGRKRGVTAAGDASGDWARAKAELVRATLATLSDTPVRQKLRRLRQIVAGYEGQLVGQDDAVATLREALQCVQDCVAPGTRDRLVDLLNTRSRPSGGTEGSESATREECLRVVRGLRVDDAAFRDDGPRSAHRLLGCPGVRGLLSELSLAVLERARGWLDPDPLDFLPALSQVRDALLDQLNVPAQHLMVRRLDPAVVAALQAVESELAALVEGGRDGIADVLCEYLESLEGDELEVRQALERYTLVLAATCQHAVHRQTRQAKGVAVGQTAIFESVIVDEAARATPLDLLIPMSLAERRIVLVGDHRQLPHLLEPDIERELSTSVNESTVEALKNSLFQRLFLHLRRLEKSDGIPRTITLDQQFRMHPALGDFVSRTFYELDEQFTSPRPACEFVHALSCVPEVPAAWLHVPPGKGREASRGSSKVRNAEARAIAEWVRRVGEERPAFTIGVISFYLQQVRELERELERAGLGEIVGGEFRFVPEWQHVANPEGERRERVRVGTVDAFQGMEFDVVFLSVTRCNSLPDATERQRRQRYGHLMLPNRLCVAMSRQHRLLVAVGDRGMTESTAAAEAIPGLVRFRELCESSQGVVLDA